MAQHNRTQAAILILILVVPPVLYFVFRNISHPIFHSVPYQYQVSPTGDTLVYTLEELAVYSPQGKPFDAALVDNEILLIDFFSLYDTLRTTVLHGNLQRVYDNIRDADYIRMLSINTDVRVSQELRDYAEDFEQYQDRWKVLWADSATVYNLGLKQLGIAEFNKWYEHHEMQETYPAFTSQTIALVDKSGKVRQHFVATDLGSIKRINEDLRALTLMEYPEELNRE